MMYTIMVSTFYAFLTTLLLGLIYFMVKAWVKSEITKSKSTDDLQSSEIDDLSSYDDHLLLLGPEQIN